MVANHENKINDCIAQIERQFTAMRGKIDMSEFSEYKIKQQKIVQKYQKLADERMATFIAKIDVDKITEKIHSILDQHKKEIDQKSLISALKDLRDSTKLDLITSIKDFSK